MKAELFFVLPLGLALTSSTRAEPITTGTLLREMTHLKHLAEFPDPAFKTVQFSSTDHRSRLPGGPDWHGNSDGFGGEPIPNFAGVIRPPNDQGIGEYLVCDVEGPGVLVRTWTARINGKIRLYLDGAGQPVYDGSAQEFFQQFYTPYLAAAKLKPEVFAGTFRQRRACYFPLPFARRCRIVWEGNIRSIHFYEVQFRLYAAPTQVRTFRPEDFQEYRQVILDTARGLSHPDEANPLSPDHQDHPLAVTLAPGEIKEALVVEGARVVERLTLQLLAPDRDRALRQTVMQIYFDGAPWGQVQSPVGDFFGAAPGINPYESLPFTVAPDGKMTCRFPMPFARSMKVRFENHGDQPVTVVGTVSDAPYTWQPERSLHFRARWRVNHGMVNTAPYDLPFLLARGQGVYVGTSSILLNPCPVPTSAGNWWGEGDEKIFVDDDQQPSIFGTGSEDYYNYAWSSPDIFLFPYCGQPRNDGPDNRGFVTNNRWHILDPIPFQRQIAFYMEFYSHERTPGYSYARIGYHYARPGTVDDHVPLSDEDVRPLIPPAWEPAARGAARGALFHPVEALLTEDAAVTFDHDPLWAGGRGVVWQPRKAGDELVLNLPVREKGRYVIALTAGLSRDFGRFSATLDGTPIAFGAKVMDLHRPYRKMLRNFFAPPRVLEAGLHTLRLRAEGPSVKGGGNALGLDFIWVQKR